MAMTLWNIGPMKLIFVEFACWVVWKSDFDG